MFDALKKPKFYRKCKSSIKMAKTRLDTIRKKKAAVLKFFKNDIVDLLKNNLDYNAYGRAEGFVKERDMSACYDMIDHFCDTIINHLSVMQKQRVCPDECKEAVPSLMYAAARFADLPELRDLRDLFSDKYGNSLDIYVNKEFVNKLAQEPPTREMKLQVMREIMKEFSTEWNPKALEQRLYTPPPSLKAKQGSLSDEEYGHKTDNVTRDTNSENQLDKNRLNGVKSYHTAPKHNERKIFSDEESTFDSSSEADQTARTELSTNHDESENYQPTASYRYVPPPYLKPKPEEKESSYENLNPVTEEKPKPRSVRRANLKFPRQEEKEVEYVHPPARVASVPSELSSLTNGSMKTHVRSGSLQTEMTGPHVHPKLPDYDEFAARFAALTGK